jgi:tetratricopeptide (TPR) repeat protein
MLDRYAAGEADAAVIEALTWNAGRLDAAVAPYSRTAAAFLLEVAASSDYPEPFHQHVAAGRALALRMLPRDPVFGRTWFQTLAALRLAHLEAGNAANDLQLLLDRVGRDPEILAARGICYEIVSTPPALPPDIVLIGKRSGSARSTSNPSWYVPMPNRASLNAAVDLYRASLALDEGNVVAQLRLGRVSHLLGKDADALLAFDAVRARATDARVLSLAALFAGQVHEEAGRIDAAAAAYRAAADLYPRGQSPYLMLARLLESQGHPDEAWTVARKVLSPSAAAETARDPWWLYSLGQTPAYDDLVIALRNAARAERDRQAANFEMSR